jgi:hypothetical protein
MAASPRSNGDICSSESVGDGVRVDSKPFGDVGQRQPARIHVGGLSEDAVVPGGLFVMARDPMAVEVGGDRGAVDAEVYSRLADGGASFVGRDQVVDVSGGEASLGRV